jgi:2-oxoglutarate/2-oxoacid ferredoxin oxidoreductase subunit beta
VSPGPDAAVAPRGAVEQSEMVQEKDAPTTYPRYDWLRPGRMPNIWCSGCGLGSVTSYFIEGVKKSGIPREKVAVVSGIGCTGRVAGYLNIDSFHTTHGRAIPFATGLSLARPEMRVAVISGDGDLFAIGGNHLIHAARRNLDLIVVCVNNFNYGMTGGQLGPTTPMHARSTTSPYGNYEHPFNLSHMAYAAGATYVARWTTLHASQLINTISEALKRFGFSFIEVLAPCPTGYGRPNKIGSGLEEMKFYKDHSVVMHNIEPSEAVIDIHDRIVVGKFVDIEKPTYYKTMKEGVSRAKKVV